MIYFDTITPAMRTVASTVYARLDPAYYLAGGTALALCIGHRMSIDLDYFIPKPINTTRLKNELLELFPKAAFIYEEIDTLWCTIDGIKVSFITRLTPCLEPIRDADEFRMASISDLVVMKLSAVSNRDEYKDYYDLAALAAVTDARTWPVLWERAHPESDPIAWIMALSHVGQMAEIPLQGKDIRTKKVIEAELQSVVRELSSFVDS